MTAKRLPLAAVMVGVCLATTPAKASHIDFREMMNAPNTLGNKGFVPQTFTTMTERTIDYTYHKLHDKYIWGQVLVMGGATTAHATQTAVESQIAGLYSVGKEAAFGYLRMASAGDSGAQLTFGSSGGSATHGSPGGGSGDTATTSPTGSTRDPGLTPTGDYTQLDIADTMAAISSSTGGSFFEPPDEGHVPHQGGAEASLAVPLPTAFIFLMTGLVGVTGAGRMRK